MITENRGLFISSGILQLMKQASVSVASKFNMLYAYAVTVVMFEIIYSAIAFHAQQGINNSAFSPQASKTSYLAGLLLGLLLYLLAAVYLVTSSKPKKVVLLLKVILGFHLISLITGLFRPSYLIIPIFLQAGFTLMMLRTLQTKKNVVLL